jgi:AAA domain (dynein-related subfamily)
MLDIVAGSPLIQLITLAYRAKMPVLVHGRHGVGKSELFTQAAATLGIGLVVRDLSVMEPPDLIGIPRVGEDGRTHYAPPTFLPREGCGLLVLEEVNRSPRYMQAPCLQLLTARQLNDYALPTGWLPCAAVNDADDGYGVEALDPALLSRFLQVKAVPDVGEWCQWARQHGVHPAIVAFVEDSPGVFEDPSANPRAWASASQLLTAWEAEGGEPALLAAALAGVLDETWAFGFIHTYSPDHRPLHPEAIVKNYPAHQAVVRRWIQQRRLDRVAASVELLKRHLQPQPVYTALIAEPACKRHVEQFFADLPAELQRQVRQWLGDRGFVGLAVRARTRSARS